MDKNYDISDLLKSVKRLKNILTIKKIFVVIFDLLKKG